MPTMIDGTILLSIRRVGLLVHDHHEQSFVIVLVTKKMEKEDGNVSEGVEED
jgi:hypothetical protein